jgi:glycosyltransferase involved in cell wall biosynthesis
LPEGLKLKICTDLPVKPPAGLARRVQVLPCPPDPEKMKELIAGAALVALPVRTTPLNPGAGLTAALLAMAMGKPVVTAGNPVVSRYLSDGRDSFLYKALTAAALASRMKRALALGPAERAAVCAAARKTALARFDMNAFAAGHLKTVLG